MNKIQINPSTLPSLPLTERSTLPTCPAVYFVMAENQILYIGRAINLRQRWNAHHRYIQLKPKTNVRIAWLECSEPILLPKIESALIEQFRPLLNGSPVARLSSEQSKTGYSSIEISLPNSMLEEMMALAKKEGWKPTDLHRILWALGFAAYTKPNSGRNLNTRDDITVT